MNSSILLTISSDELKAMMIEVFKELSAKYPSAAEKDEIIDRAELCKRLNLVEPTIIKWEKKGKIPSLRVGSAVRYSWFKVLNALEKKGGKPS
ncbi:hypothetical protein DC498_17705 [Terrimonas sp.]|uniref:hypothetical protein n=1 Tax=Terrimonas sp. TaxID=1914338 RepID=UPI000D50D6FD|nr:hypothetical protein [Terrimonas sp.]PVD50808.1 hypothetical protein DC498_17705 [Terrimonas sp.]